MRISQLINSLFNIYWWLIIVRIFLTWVPSIRWENQPFNTLRKLVDPLLAPFRSLIPSIGGLDISPIVALLFLQFVQVAIVKLFMSFGL